MGHVFDLFLEPVPNSGLVYVSLFPIDDLQSGHKPSVVYQSGQGMAVRLFCSQELDHTPVFGINEQTKTDL